MLRFLESWWKEKTLFIKGAIFFGVLISVLVYLGFSSGFIQKWVHERTVRAYVKKIQPGFPLKIEKVVLSSGWAKIMRGEPSQLEVQLSRGAFFVHLVGDLSLEWGKEEVDVGLRYLPKAKFYYGGREDSYGAEMLPLDILLTLQADFRQLSRIEIKARHTNWKWPVLQLESDDLLVDLQWKKGKLQGQLSWGALTWENDDAQQAFSMAKLKLQLQTGFSIKKLQLGPELSLQWQAEAAEYLQGENYYEIPLQEFPGRWQWRGLLDFKQKSYQVEFARLSSLREGFYVELLKPEESSSDGMTYRIRWNLESLPLQHWEKQLPRILSLEDWPSLQVSSGSLSLTGEAQLSWGVSRGDIKKIKKLLEVRELKNSFQVKDLSVRWPERKLALKGFYFDFPLELRKKTQGFLGSQQIQWRNLKGPWKKSLLDFAFQGDLAKLQWRLRVRIPDGLSLSFSKKKILLGKSNLAIEGGGNSPWRLRQLQSSLVVPTIEMKELAQSLCLAPDHFPPSQVKLQLPRISYQDHSVDMEGEFLWKLFGGRLRAKDFRVKNIFKASSRSEVALEMDWKGVQLDQIERWIPFGKVNGLLEGHAKQVLLRDFTPVRYDFLLRVKPFRKSDVVFSPEAMKNFVRLVSGENIDKKMPGIVRWFVFGWPRRLFGGYDVEYVGLALKSRQGVIELTTLDPPEVVKETGQHFILKGSGLSGFNMPIRSSSYPVYLNAAAVTHFVQHLKDVLGGIKSKKGPSGLIKPLEERQSEDQQETKEVTPDGVSCFG